MIKIKKNVQVDKGLEKPIKWLNKNDFTTISCCSGNHSGKDLFHIEFVGLKNVHRYLLMIHSRELGFSIKQIGREGLRIETFEFGIPRIQQLIKLLKKNKDAFKLRTMGISNWVKDESKKRRNIYSVQFYDYDGVLTDEQLEIISEIFPYDCIVYRTKHGFQFISFSLLHGLRYTKTKVLEISKQLNQDYWTEGRDLTLRVASKWEVKKNQRKTISEKPKFYAFLKAPYKHIISKKHLEFYHDYMDLPEDVYEAYSECDMRDYKIKIYHYITRD